MSKDTPDYEDNLYFDTQNTKKDLASEQLIEQWKKGELPEGWYWVIKTGDVEMLEYCCNCFLDGYVPLIGNEVTEVLAPVPSYDELQNMNKAVNECMAANIKLVEENKQLKELLKKLYKQADVSYCEETLLDKIDEVLK